MPGVITAYAVYVLERSFNWIRRRPGHCCSINGLIVAIATVVATVPAARMSDRIGRKKVIYVAFALGGRRRHRRVIAPTVELTVAALLPLGFSTGAFLVVDWALMTDIIPKAAAGRYMGISNVATASAGPVGLALAGVVLYLVTRAGAPLPGAPDVGLDPVRRRSAGRDRGRC